MQKFHLPAIVTSDESQIKATCYESMLRGVELSIAITRANNDVVQKLEITGGASDIICQRVDCILQTPSKSAASAKNKPSGHY